MDSEATRMDWSGISASALEGQESLGALRVCFEDDLAQIQSARWLLRNDTFPGNLGLFRPANVTSAPGGGLSLAVIEEPLGVRNLSAAAISSRANFLFGRFEATLQATNVPGLVTGFFLHRDSPRQEIDVEILGNRPDHLLVNVFYNPGTNGAKFDYGYRGTPIIIELGFDASKALHQFTIEWDPCEIRWFVDQQAGSPSRHLGSDPDPSPTNDVAREYLADPLTRARGPAGTPRAACVSDRAPSRRRYIQRGPRASVAVTNGCLGGISELAFGTTWSLSAAGGSYAGENFPTAIGEAIEKALVRSARKRRSLYPPNRSGGLQPCVAKRLGRTYEVVRTARTIPVAYHWREFAGQNMNESLVVALKVLCHSLWRQWDLDCLVGR